MILVVLFTFSIAQAADGVHLVSKEEMVAFERVFVAITRFAMNLGSVARYIAY